MQKLKFFEENATATKGVLKNGLTLLINESRAHPVVAISTFVKSGYMEETDENAGISDVIASLFYRATTNRGPGIIARDVKAMGGVLSSEAGFDHMLHDLVVPSAQWKRALEIQADALLNPLADPDDLKLSIERALSDIVLEGEDPARNAYQRLIDVGLNLRGGLRSTIVEDPASGLNRQKVLDFYRAHYAASRIILSISGDINSSEVLTEVVRLYERTRAEVEKSPPNARPEAPRGFRYREVHGPTPTSIIMFGFPAPLPDSSDYPAFEILRVFVGTGRASLLSRRLADQKKIILSGSASLADFTGAGYLSVRMDVEGKNIDRSEIGLLSELELLKRDEPSEDDFQRALAQLEREFWQAQETVSGKAHLLAEFESRGDWKKVSQHLSRLRAVKPTDLPKIAEKYFRLDRCALVEYLPHAEEKRNLTAETALRTLQELLPSASDLLQAEREKETVPAVKMPEAATSYRLNEIRYPMQKASVLRGPELFIREDHSLPLIHMGFFYPGGRLHETKENEGITAFMLRCLLRGSKEMPAELLNRQLELYGGCLTPVVEKDYFGVNVSVLSRNIEAVLDLLREMFLNASFAEDEAIEEKAASAALERGGWVSGLEESRRMAAGDLFKGHAYGLSSFSASGNQTHLTAAAVKEWHRTLVHNRKPIIVIIGDTQGTSLAGFFVKNFSGSRFQDSKLPETYPKSPEKRVLLEKTRERNESLSGLSFQAPPDGDEDYFPVLMLANLLGGDGGRLADQILGASGSGRRVVVDYDAGVRGGMFLAAVYSSPGNADKALAGLESEIRKLAENPLPYRDFRSALNSTLGNHWIGQQRRFSQIEMLVKSLESGRGLEGVLEFTTRIQEVKQEDLPEIARRILNPDKAVTIKLKGTP